MKESKSKFTDEEAESLFDFIVKKLKKTTIEKQEFMEEMERIYGLRKISNRLETAFCFE